MSSSHSRSPTRHRQPAPSPVIAGSLAESLLVAAEALEQVMAGQALNDGLAALWSRHPHLSPPSRGAVQDMLYGTLRDYGRGEAVLSRLLASPLADNLAKALLCVALHRLETRPELAHTVVDQAVEAAARIAAGRYKGLVNGVLRNALRQRDTLIAGLEATPATKWRHPMWWISALQKAWPSRWEAILGANNTRSPMSLRINPRRNDLAAYEALLDEQGIGWRALGTLALQLDSPRPVAQLPGFAEGLVSVQDWGAQQAALLLGARDGECVLDACAAPGGKTAHILELADVELLAIDLEETRAARVSETLKRLGLSAAVRAADCRRPEQWWDGRAFDRILADVPCSASGVVRRHPDIKWLRRAEDVARFATVQAQILDALWPLLAPGGKMLYVTCSVFPEENSLQLSHFLTRHADCRRSPFADGSIEQQCLPGPDHDGFYFALLEKRA